MNYNTRKVHKEHIFTIKQKLFQSFIVKYPTLDLHNHIIILK